MPLAAAVAFMSSQAKAQFANVVNIPPMPDLPAEASVADDTQVNLFLGGSIGDGFNAGRTDAANLNVEVNLLGGAIGRNFIANQGVVVNVLDGSIGPDSRALPGSKVNIMGNTTVYLLAATSSIEVSDGASVSGQLILNRSSKLHISGGVISANVVAHKSDVSISGGAVEEGLYGDLYLDRQSSLTITGGRVERTIVVDDHSAFTMTGGVVGEAYVLNSYGTVAGGQIETLSTGDSTISIMGGAIKNLVSRGPVQIYGGAITDQIYASPGCHLNFHGRQFALDGVDITNQLILGQPFTVSERNVTLSGRYRDGTTFEIPLTSSSEGSGVRNRFFPGTSVSLHLVPEPHPHLLLLGGSLVGLYSGCVWREKRSQEQLSDNRAL